MPSPVFPFDSGLRWVQMCMRLGLNQTKNGFLSRLARSMKSMVAVRNSASIVSMRFLLTPWAKARVVARRVGSGGNAFEYAARSKICAERRGLRIVFMLGLFLGI